MTYEHEIRQGGFDIATVKPLAGSKKAFLAAIAGSEKMSPTSFFPKVRLFTVVMLLFLHRHHHDDSRDIDDYKLQPLWSGVRIEVEGMNMTIDSRYCSERSCNEKKGRYHLFVPVSPYMPTTPVMLRIT